MVQHQQRQSQQRSTNTRLWIDSATPNTCSPHPTTAPPRIDRQVGLPPSSAPPSTVVGVGVAPPLSQTSHSCQSERSSITPMAPAPSTNQSPLERSLINVSMASADADPRSRPASAYCGSPISLFPDDDVSHINTPVIFDDSRPVPSARVPARLDGNPPMDPMSQLLQGFQDMFHRQDQDWVHDRVARDRFEAMIRALVSPRPASDYVQSYVESIPAHVLQGQYCPAPIVTADPIPVVTSSDLPSSSLFPHAHMPIPPDRRAHHRGSDHDSRYNEPPFLAVITKTSQCSKFKEYLEDSVQLSSDSLTSLELFVDGVKSALDMVMCPYYSLAHYNEWALDCPLPSGSKGVSSL
jgi:hypothetical protein